MPRALIHEFNECEIRFILILRHIAVSRCCWYSITKAFNEAFSTEVKERCLIKKCQTEQQRKNPFYRHLKENGTVPSEFQGEYEEILRRFGTPSNHQQKEKNGYRYSPAQVRFISILAILTKDEEGMKWKRWTSIAACFNEYFSEQTTKEALCSRWTRCQKENGPFIQTLEETGMVPDEFLQEYQDILQAYRSLQNKCFPGISSNDESQFTRTRPYKETPAPLFDEKMLFLTLLEHSSSKTWEEITNSFNEEFNMHYSQISLFQHFETERPKYPLYHILEGGGTVPQELVGYRDSILNKYGVEDVMQQQNAGLACDEVHMIEHSGPVRPCVGFHPGGYKVCESCKTIAFRGTLVASTDDLDTFARLYEAMDFSNTDICKEQGEEWLCNGCRVVISYLTK